MEEVACEGGPNPPHLIKQRGNTVEWQAMAQVRKAKPHAVNHGRRRGGIFMSYLWASYNLAQA